MQAGERRQSGFTYLALLFAVALIGLGLSITSEVWVRTIHRQKLEQLEWVGDQYARAIGSYYFAAPGRPKALPRSLEELLEDKRFAFPRHHLRSMYVNPFTGKMDLETVTSPDGGIRGVRFITDGDTTGSIEAFEFTLDATTQAVITMRRTLASF
jgi:type II secretory pathway pseudopilin PulG